MATGIGVVEKKLENSKMAYIAIQNRKDLYLKQANFYIAEMALCDAGLDELKERIERLEKESEGEKCQ